ncbi:hypothetical protein BGZ61DRAFT_511580 [Ilyonectria robusta]|uniref:uncharacterized protein n=1 Tax=Ilyonectria robusta TaxID=1079257 RepID=UPI001E8CF1D5|nr:uncharacterized protein BGZ61DRAFT_511580 [Ilyonectria robusta]KAH8736865.1 hypothetical protein BGZ61DRAFT_511580 [Ilyonectria robusta]
MAHWHMIPRPPPKPVQQVPVKPAVKPAVQPATQSDIKAARVEHIVEYTLLADSLQVIALIATLVCLPLHTAISNSLQPSDSEPASSASFWIAICVGVVAVFLFFVAGVVRKVAREEAWAGSAPRYRATYHRAGQWCLLFRERGHGEQGANIEVQESALLLRDPNSQTLV